MSAPKEEVGSHHLEVEGVAGDKTRLSFYWEDKKGFLLRSTNVDNDDNWGWGIGAFTYVKNGQRILVSNIGPAKRTCILLILLSATSRVVSPRTQM